MHVMSHYVTSCCTPAARPLPRPLPRRPQRGRPRSRAAARRTPAWPAESGGRGEMRKSVEGEGSQGHARSSEKEFQAALLHGLQRAGAGGKVGESQEHAHPCGKKSLGQQSAALLHGLKRAGRAASERKWEAKGGQVKGMWTNIGSARRATLSLSMSTSRGGRSRRHHRQTR